MTFNPNEHLLKLKNKDYLEVKWRLVWFRAEHPHGTIGTTLVQFDLEKQFALFAATVADGEGGSATGHGSETAKDFPDFIEKAESKAIGRALAALGYGTQFAPELEEGERVVDAPVENEHNGHAPQGQKPSALEQAIAQMKREFEEQYPEFVKGNPDWFAHFQRTVLGELPAQLTSTDVARMRSYLAEKRKKQPAQQQAS